MVLGVFFDLILNVVYKCGRFSKILLEKSLKFVPCKRSYFVSFYPSLVLLLAEVDSISEEQSCKRDKLVAYDISRVKIILVFLTEIVTLYMQAPII